MSFEPPTYLANKNAHPRDKNITFDEGPHIYTIAVPNNDGTTSYDSGYTSVTTWNHSHFPHFDPDAIITKMMKSPKWPQSQYYGMTPDEIKAQWSANGKEASEAGTKMHYDIECFYNECPNENDSTEYKWFLEFEKARTQSGGFGENLTPYRTEMMVYHEELRLSGSIDMIYEADDGTLQIYDWKRSKGIKKTNSWENATTECINHLPNANYWHYSLQLNTYKAILEEKYGKKVTDLFLVCLHPNNANKSYQRIRVPILSDEIKDLFALRLEQVKHMTLNTITMEQPATNETDTDSGDDNNVDYYVYTDGACSNNGKPSAKAGMGIYFGPNDSRNVSRKVDGKQTNNVAELSAIIEAYNIVKPDIDAGKHIVIATDSEYVMKCVSTYGKKMKAKNYMKKGAPIPNASLVKEAYEQYSSTPNVSFKHIRAHTKRSDIHSVGNDNADRLANEAIGLTSCPYQTKAPPKKTTTKKKFIVAKKLYLKVPYAKKDIVKQQEGRWDPMKKKWYIYDTNPNRESLLEEFS